MTESEVEKLAARDAEQGLVKRHVSWTAKGAALSDEAKAAELNKIDAWLAVPANNLASRLRGEAFLKRDTAMCLRSRFDVRTLQSVEMTPREKYEADKADSLAALLEEAADFIAPAAVKLPPQPDEAREET